MNRSVSEKIVVVVPAYNEEKTIAGTLLSLVEQVERPDAVVVVDNGSTDSTAEVVRYFQSKYRWIRLVYEPQKGTGFACNAGCKCAIQECGATILCRTDADTVVSVRWVKAIRAYFEEHPDKQMVSGPRPARTDDEYYRWYDSIVYVPYWWLMRAFSAIRTRQLFWMKLMPGHNLSIRTEAYLKSGEFALSNISDSDEDVELFLSVRSTYGDNVFGLHKDIEVRTSTRRVRTMGYLRLALYYLTKPNRERRLAYNKGTIDIR